MDRVYVMELVRSHQLGEISRPDFVARASLAAGGLSAANSLAAACALSPPSPPPVLLDPASGPDVKPTEALTPQAAASTGAMVEYPARTTGAALAGYLSQPPGGAKGAPVVVVQEWWGLNDHIKDVANRFASEGFVALAPDLYHGAVVSEPDEARKLLMEMDMVAAAAEIGAAADYLRHLDESDGSDPAVVGFCMGGRLALRTVLVEHGLATVVPFYGTPLTPEQAPYAKAPILGLYGEEDTGIPVEDVRTMEAALTAAGIETEIHVYPDAGHAFFNDTRERYSAEAAKNAWSRTLAWLRKHQQG